MKGGAPRISGVALCRLDAIGPDGKGVVTPDGGQDIFLIRRGACVHGYVNACPHAGTPLDWTPDRFLDAARAHIVCATHGAHFRIDDGYCISGPCAGDRLTPVRLEVIGASVHLCA